MSTEKSYHHRNLPVALRAVTAELVSERGPAGFSLREVARRAGVSHAAPAHHFGDTRGLLTSLAAEGFQHLANALGEAAQESDAATRLKLCGKAYVTTALKYPGHFAVIFRDDLLDSEDPELERHGSAAFACLSESVQAVRDQVNPDLDLTHATTMCWATMQGLVTLAPILESMDPEKFDNPGLEASIDALTTMILDGFRPR